MPPVTHPMDPVLWSHGERVAMLADAVRYSKRPRGGESVAVYCTPEEKTSPAVALAFAQGCGGRLVLDGKWQGDLPAGAMMPSPDPASWALHERGIGSGRPFYSINKGYFGRGAYFRVTLGAMQHELPAAHLCSATAHAGARWEGFGIPIRPWRKDGQHILLCPNSNRWFEMRGTTFAAWRNGVQAMLARHTDRPILARWKTTARPLESDLENCWAVVVFDSNAGVEAALQGVPVIATEPSAARAFGSGDLAGIENPRMPTDDERYQLAATLAANQWTLDEMRAGQCWGELREQREVA